jgi:hypothetical protein
MVDTRAADLTRIAVAADPNIVGVAILKKLAAVDAGATVILRADGLRLRVDTASGQPSQAALAALLAADLSPAAVKARDDAAQPAKAMFRDLVATALQNNNDFLALGANVNLAAAVQQLRRLSMQNNAMMKRLYQLSEGTGSEL